MTKIICKECKCIITEDAKNVKERYIQCPNCFRIAENPLYEENET